MKKYLIADEETRDIYGKKDFSCVFEHTTSRIREVEKIDVKDIFFEWMGKQLVVSGEYVPPEARKELPLEDLDARFLIPKEEPYVALYRRDAFNRRDLAIALKKLSVIFEACK